MVAISILLSLKFEPKLSHKETSMIKLELTPELYGNLRILVLAGSKSPQTGEDAVIAGAHLLQVMAQALEASKKPSTPPANGQAGSPDSHTSPA